MRFTTSSTLISVESINVSIPTGIPGSTFMVVVELIFPELAVIVVIPAFPGTNKPVESILPSLADQLICSFIGFPLESFTTASNLTAWSASTETGCESMTMLAGVDATTLPAIWTSIIEIINMEIRFFKQALPYQLFSFTHLFVTAHSQASQSALSWSQ